MSETFLFEGKHAIFLGARATLIENEREIASDWASQHIRLNPAHAFVLGRFVEADRANNNNQYWTLDDLEFGKPSIEHAPMNVNHSSRNIVGAFTASELIFPTGESADAGNSNPYIENLGVFWKYYFPREYQQVAAANAQGQLFYSMECVPEFVSTIGGSDDTVQYAYEGRQSPTYPEEMNKREVPMRLGNPHFVGGALVIPPSKPGWKHADTQIVAEFMNEFWSEAERAMDSIEDALPSESAMWESLMNSLIMADYELEVARDFSAKKRMDYAKTGVAMPDGSFPIPDMDALHRAIKLAGNAKDPAAARAHIKKRAKALGAEKAIPMGWA